MLFYPFKNYDEFKEKFGIIEHGNGAKNRRNKILLQWLKQKWVLDGAVFNNDARDAINVGDLDRLRTYIYAKYVWNSAQQFTSCLMNWTVYSDEYVVIDGGICEDGDYRAVRYCNKKLDSRVFKMKAGKFLKNLLMENEWSKRLCEPVVLWLCEDFTQQWETYVRSLLPEHKLVVDDDFSAIYNEENLRGDFHSCMVFDDEYDDHSSFYTDAVNAKAASLRTDDGEIIARAIIFTDVTDVNTGEKVRLCERQYSSDGQDVLKRLLVDALIKAGEIDGYKRVGADCHNSLAFVANDGTSWGDRRFVIDCKLENGDTLSYQDSFKWYDESTHKAYNFDASGTRECLDETDLTYEGGESGNWDSWNERYTDNEIVIVYYHGREYTCDEECLDDFVMVDEGSGEGEYHYSDDVTWCAEESVYVLDREARYSDVLGDYFYDEDLMEDKENEYKEQNWFYSEYDGEYFKDARDVVTLHKLDGEEITISRMSLEVNFVAEMRDDHDWYEIEK